MRALKRQQRGLTLIEIVLGVALATVVLAFILVQFSRLNEAERSRTLINFVADLMKELPKTAPSRAYDGLTSETLINLGVVPDQFIGEDRVSLLTPWLEPLEVTDYTFGESTRPNAALIAIQGVPTAACTELIQALGRNMLTVEVGTEVLIQRAGPTPRLFSTLTPADVVEACSATRAPTVRMVPNG
ncbi:type 4 pilus major pilin [Aquimonas sp.]|jgi:hypothetical protein|uniref:type 4 pilus major pilin n=1 Tax=Aquimonas sp. TaxID=1872588 RepID=UPI0037C08658